jgi:hypothetical protein
MSSDLADHAYGHCLAVLLEPNLAEEAARDALRRGSWTATAVLAHARSAALDNPANLTASDGTTAADLARAELSDVARQLTAGRPPIERAIVDLHGRHGLDRLRFARTLGLDPTRAAAGRAMVAETWAATLDPALLARLGPGDCDGLAAILASRGMTAEPGTGQGEGAAGPGGGEESDPTITAEMLLAAVPMVSEHADGCAACRDRLRAMISVADLVTRIPLEAAPAEVGVVLQRTGRRRRRPAPLPPPVDAEQTYQAHRALRRRLVAGAVIASVAAIVGAGTVAAERAGRHGNNDRILALTKLPDTNALSVDRPTVLVPGGSFVLMNLSRRPLRRQANSPVAWLGVDPGSGSLGPGAQIRLQSRILGTPPGVLAAVTVAITADDGSAAAVQATTASAAPPDVAASLVNCVVTATAEAPQGIANVVLHWRLLAPSSGASASATAGRFPRHMDPSAPPVVPPSLPSTPDHIVAMTMGHTGYVAPLPTQSSEPIQWWVGAVDNGGDQVNTVIQILGPGSCD